MILSNHMNLRIIDHSRIWFSLSGVLIALSILALFVWGLRPGIDFTGGTSIDLSFTISRPNAQDIHKALAPLQLGELNVSPIGEKDITVRTKPLDEKQHAALIEALNKAFAPKEAKDKVVTQRQFQTVGPVIGSELQRKTVWAIALAILGIVLLISWNFRKVSYPVKSWKYGVATIIALLHDVTIPTGAYAVMGHFLGYEANALLVVALLTVLGFSVHDTIVVFDRTRENLHKHRGLSFAEVVNQSLNETFVRSVNTSLTLLIILATTFFFGGETIRDFILTLLIGVFFGTYSSIFIASPILVSWYEWNQNNRTRA